MSSSLKLITHSSLFMYNIHTDYCKMGSKHHHDGTSSSLNSGKDAIDLHGFSIRQLIF